MDKKDLHKMVDTMVVETATAQNVPEVIARSLVGMVILKNKQALLASIGNGVMTPAGA